MCIPLQRQNVNALVASLCSHKALRIGLAITPCSGHCALTWVLLRELASKIQAYSFSQDM